MFAGFDTAIQYTWNMHETKQNWGQPQIDFLLRCASSLQLITIDVQGRNMKNVSLFGNVLDYNFRRHCTEIY